MLNSIEAFFQSLDADADEKPDGIERPAVTKENVVGVDQTVVIVGASNAEGLSYAYWPRELELGWWIRATTDKENSKQQQHQMIDESTGLLRSLLIGISEFHVMTPLCRRWRRKRTMFEEKAKLFLEGRNPVSTCNKL